MMPVSEQEPPRPLPSERYRGRRYPLPAVPRVLGSFRADALVSLSALLHYTFGVAVQELGPSARWPYHRTVPSARCLYPTQLRCWIPPTAGLPGGCYSYDPAHHALVPVRAGEVLDELGTSVGADLTGAACVLVLTSVFARTAARYGSYAYRLCTQEAGMVAGNALLVAGVLGWQGHVHHHFRAAVLDRLLGIPWPDESVMSLVALYPWRAGQRRRLVDRPETTDPAWSPIVAVTSAPTLDRATCAELLEIDRASRDWASPARLAVEHEPLSPAPDPADYELAQALRRRWSGSPTLAPIAKPLPRKVIDRIVRHARDAHGSDVVPEGAPPPVDCYLWLNAVEGTEPGVYLLRGNELHWSGSAAPLAEAVPTTNVDHRAANALVYLVVDAAAGTRVLGDRSFRILHHEAGIVAQRICVTAAAESLVARVHNGYPAGPVAQALGLPPGQEPVFQIMLGAARPGDVYRMPIHHDESW